MTDDTQPTPDALNAAVVAAAEAARDWRPSDVPDDMNVHEHYWRRIAEAVIGSSVEVAEWRRKAEVYDRIAEIVGEPVPTGLTVWVANVAGRYERIAAEFPEAD